ncbi:MAG: hypothetical protein QXI10_02040 [Candidatus Diapherotrites archaeon]
MRFFLFLFLFLLPAFSFAVVELSFPVSQKFESSPLFIGNVSPGQSFDLVFSDDSGLGFDWDYVKVDYDSLPRLWSVVSYSSTSSSLSVTLRIPSSTEEGVYSFKVVLGNSSNNVSEFADIIVGVKKNLVSVSFSRPFVKEKLLAFEPIEYSVFISNASIGYDNIFVSANVPSNWFSSKSFLVRPNEDVEVKLVVFPQYYGSKTLRFSALLGSVNHNIASFESKIYVEPSLKGKFGSSLSGFPFFTFSLLPFQLIGSLVSLLG